VFRNWWHPIIFPWWWRWNCLNNQRSNMIFRVFVVC
jgi:hypothetical protein